MPLVFIAVFFARDDSRIGAYIEELPATHVVGDTIDDARANLLHEVSLTLAAYRRLTQEVFGSARVVMRKPLTMHDGHRKEVDNCGRKHSRLKDH